MELLFGLALFYGAWPLAAYVSARAIRRKSEMQSVRWAILVWLLSAVFGAYLSALSYPLRENHPHWADSLPVLWACLPLLLLVTELAFRRARRGAGPHAPHLPSRD